MYNSIISNALKHSKANSAKLGADSTYGGGTNSIRVHTGATSRIEAEKANAASCTTTSSIMKSGDNLPHLIPQKTNVLTGATTSYFSKQASAWRSDYADLVSFQKSRLK